MGAVIVGTLWLVTSGVLSASGHIDVGYGSIRSIQLRPVPEGPQGPLFVPRPHSASELPLALVQGFVLTPLPAPLDQGHCSGGGDLVIVLKSGRRITYGPCRWPWQISELWGAMIESGELVGCVDLHRENANTDLCRAFDAERGRAFHTSS